MNISTTRICVFSLVWYICEKCELTAMFLGGGRFGHVFWKNRVHGTQNFVRSSKSTLKVAKRTIENRKNFTIQKYDNKTLKRAFNHIYIPAES